MLGFNYIYQNSQEILSKAIHLKDVSVLDIVFIVSFIFITLLGIFIIIPLSIIIIENIHEKKQKKVKKKILTQILLQKEIEDEVENEIQIEERDKVL